MSNINKSAPDDQNMSGGHKNRLAATHILVGSQLPSDVRRGLGQLRNFLNENNEDGEVYELLWLAANNNPFHQDEVLNLIQEHERRGSRAAGMMAQKLAQQVTKIDTADTHAKKNLASVPEKKQNLIDDADDAYYAAEFDRAITLYRQVLNQEPDNQRARQQLDKAELNQLSKKSGQDLPREAMQYYRRARSYIAGRDVKSAISMLNAAIEEARSKGKSFPEADDLLASQHNLEVAVEFKQEADTFIASAQWEQAVERYERVLNLDPTDELTRDLRRRSKDLLEAEALLLSLAEPLELQDRKEKLENIAQTIKSAEKIYNVAKSDRFRALRARHRIYKAEFDFHASRFKGSAKGQLVQALSAAQSVLAPDDPAVVYATGQLAKNGRASFPFWILLIITLVFVGIGLGGWRVITNMISETPASATTNMTLTPSLLLSLTPALTKTKLVVTTPSPTLTLSPSMTFAPSPTTSFIITSTPQPDLVTAYITATYGHYLDAPNGRWIGEMTRNQAVTVLEKRLLNSGEVWYFCEWEKNDLQVQGWIFGDFLSFAPRNTATPTATPTK